MRPALAFVTASALTGCSWIYNPSNIDTSRIDAPSDAEVILDADPSMLSIENVSPATISEGQGDGGSAPALVVLYGHNIVDANTKIELIPVSPLPDGVVMPEVGAPVVAKDGNWLAFPVTAHVDPKLTSAMGLAFTVQVTEDTKTPGVQSMATTTLMLQGLDELAPGASGKAIDISKLATLYSSVTLPAGASFMTTGTTNARAIIHATASITAQDLTAAAGAAGGCAGGGASSPGGCAGGGGGTSGGGGGGGAGCATAGVAGIGTGAGGQGQRTGDELMVSYDGNGSQSASQSPGGGGGALSAVLSLAGGAGGAGGGTIELTAEGDVTVGAVAVNGGGGAQGSGGGGGGGGAGGLVMLRAGHMLTTSGAISVSGGAGYSMNPSNGKSGTGGDGSGGRIRWDARLGSAPTMATPMAGTPGSLHRGPAFALDSDIVRDPKAKITVLGTPDDRFHTYAINYDPAAGPQTIDGQTQSIGPGGSVTFTQTLQQGLTQLCLTLDGGKQGSSEADKCVWVAFLP